MSGPARSAEALLRQCVGGAGATIDIAEAALACAAMERPGLDMGPYRAHLAAIARDMAAVESSEPASLLADVLVERHGYRGDRDSYDDLDNADLARVIDRRRGLPVALAILWMHAARSRGWSCVGLNTPNHFIVQLDARGERRVLDPFDGGRMLDEPALAALLRRAQAGGGASLGIDDLVAVDDRSVLLRLQNNIKLRLVRAGDSRRALKVVERMLIVAPRAVDLWREASALNADIDNLRSAVECLDKAMALAAGEGARQRIAAERARLTGRLN
ncbi:MAG: tetratricopeptide repeat protein [Alphaproteobacteria bacterium]|nr:tetratricopeptide repeat protein [Alphaproteobacteria bacterium]